MATAVPQCPKCAVAMAAGYMPDSGHFDALRLAGWTPGIPERGWFGAPKLKRGRYPVVTYR